MSTKMGFGVTWEKAIIDVQTRKPRSPNKIRRSRLLNQIIQPDPYNTEVR
jgi:hypothetical protein